MSVIDAHVHLWDLDVRPQPWTDPFPVLRRSFRLDELTAVLASHGVDAAVVVQAGDTTGETLDLLALAAGTARLAGVVGWVDLTSADVAQALSTLRSAPGGSKLVAVRHQLQVEPDPAFLARRDVRAGLAAVAAAGLTYDVVISPSQLPIVIEVVAALPQLRFVLDHAGKPAIAAPAAELDRWRADLAELATAPNVAVKLSGLVTEADWVSWTQAQLEPVIEHVLTCFGPSRVMAGSDWPVCLLAADYRTVQATLAPMLARLGPDDRAEVLGGTATRWYPRAAP
jgi:L-fuconolactonase